MDKDAAFGMEDELGTSEPSIDPADSTLPWPFSSDQLEPSSRLLDLIARVFGDVARFPW